MTARALAHTVKSASANMGAARLSDLCRQLESASDDENLDTAQELFARIRHEFESVSCALAQDNEGGGMPGKSVASTESPAEPRRRIN